MWHSLPHTHTTHTLVNNDFGADVLFSLHYAGCWFCYAATHKNHPYFRAPHGIKYARGAHPQTLTHIHICSYCYYKYIKSKVNSELGCLTPTHTHTKSKHRLNRCFWCVSCLNVLTTLNAHTVTLLLNGWRTTPSSGPGLGVLRWLPHTNSNQKRSQKRATASQPAATDRINILRTISIAHRHHHHYYYQRRFCMVFVLWCASRFPHCRSLQTLYRAKGSLCVVFVSSGADDGFLVCLCVCSCFSSERHNALCVC